MENITVAKFNDMEIYIGQLKENVLVNAMRLIAMPVNQQCNQQSINIAIVPALYPIMDILHVDVNIKDAIVNHPAGSDLEKQYISAVTGIKAPSLGEMIKLVKR